ncbi:MAG: NAD(+) diphosphatase [Candidatus Handelsmanbacteria bacterium]|nr:NAD(+) diphosphatase [Candidatus Handelsmanbacteria bacterium]
MTALSGFVPLVAPPSPAPDAALIFAFSQDRLLVYLEGKAARVPVQDQPAGLGLTLLRQQYLGTLGQTHCYSAELEQGAQPPAGMALKGLRQLFGLLPEEHFWAAGRAVQVVNWDRTHQYCGQCGAPTLSRPTTRAKECPSCGLLSFPRVSPAIIVLVEREGQMLLARNHRFPPNRYSVIAGFVEPGETLEEAVAREVREEVNVEVAEIRYFGSQPWPFPHSLMVGFTAQYVGGEIRPDPEELAGAAWFGPDHLPDLPDGISISRKLIDWFLAKHRG